MRRTTSRSPSPFTSPDAVGDDPGRRRRRNLLSATVVVATTGAIGLGAVAWTAQADRGEVVVLDVDDAIADSLPDTVAPVSIETLPPTTIAASSSPPSDTTDDVASTDDVAEGLSPLADLLGPRYSAVPDEIEPRPQPRAILTDRIDLSDYPVRPVGLEDDGQLEVPDETEIGWYRYGATSGRPGATVLAAHVSWNDTTGPFFRLGTMEPGDRISVELTDGTEREYLVVERTMYDKQELPRDRIWRNTGPETLVLITCGGDFNPEIRRYRQNIVVYAVPVA
ncbi:MAG: class F sortase [Actinomycetota bacterium]